MSEIEIKFEVVLFMGKNDKKTKINNCKKIAKYSIIFFENKHNLELILFFYTL